jgi:hypothetical protein
MTAIRDLRSAAVSAAKSIPGLRPFYRSRYAPLAYAATRDRWNRLRFGPGAPRFAERLWIDPRRVEQYDRLGLVWQSGRVVTGAWRAGKPKPIEEDPVLRSAIAHWVEGVPWEDTGEIERVERAMETLEPGQIREWHSRAEILARCARLDAIFRTIERERRVRPQGETQPGAFREFGGIGMHVGPGGVPIRAGHGRHRFAIARILEIPRIPVCVGLVHQSGLPHLEEYRKEPAS